MAVATSPYAFPSSSSSSTSNHVPAYPHQHHHLHGSSHLSTSHLPNGKSPASAVPSRLGLKSQADLNLTQPSREPFARLDTLGMKARLLDVLKGPDGECYLKNLGLFLVGKLRRDEWEGMMVKVLNTSLKRQLHNQLLTALLHNASSTLPPASTPTLPLIPHPTSPGSSPLDPAALLAQQTALQALERGLPGDERRVRKWVLEMGQNARARMKERGRRVWSGEDREEWEGLGGAGKGMGVGGSARVGEMDRGWQGSSRKRKHLQMFDDTSLPYCQTTGILPSPEELQSRIEALAREHGMPRGAADGVGEFVGLALETHLDGLFYAAWQMIQGNPAEDASADISSDLSLLNSGLALANSQSKDSLTTQPSSAGVAEGHENNGGGESNTTSPTNISDDVPVGAAGRGTTEPAEGEVPEKGGMDGDVEMRDGDREDEESAPAGSTQQDRPPRMPTPGPSAGPPIPPSDSEPNPFPPRHLTLQDMQSLLQQMPNLLPHASSSVYKLETNFYRAMEEEEILAERLSRERDQRFQAKQAELVASYQKEFELRNRIQAETLMRQREREMDSRRRKESKKMRLDPAGWKKGLRDFGAGAAGGDVDAVQSGGSEKAAPSGEQTPAADSPASGAVVSTPATADAMDNDVKPTVASANEEEADPRKVMVPQKKADKENDVPLTKASQVHPSSSRSGRRPGQSSSLAAGGVPGVGGIILRPSAKAKLEKLGYSGPLGGGMIPAGGFGMAMNGGAASDLDAIAQNAPGAVEAPSFTLGGPVNPAVETLKHEMLMNELLKPLPLPVGSAADQAAAQQLEAQARAAGQGMGLAGDDLERYVAEERQKDDEEKQRTMVVSAMRGLPVNTGNHWAYVDPALLLRDILG